MAREVIAQVDIDESGVVRAVQRSVGEMGRLETGSSRAARTLQREWDNSGAAFVKRMFSMQAAAGALLGGLGIAGLINGLKNLVESVLRSNEQFGSFQESSGRARQSLLNLANELFNVGGALQEAERWMLRFAASMDLIGEFKKKHPEASKDIGLIGTALFGSDKLAFLRLLQGSGQLLDRMLGAERLEAAGAKPATRVPEDNWTDALRKAPPAIQRAQRALEELDMTVRDTWVDSETLFVGFEAGWEDTGRIIETDITHISTEVRTLFTSLEQLVEQFDVVTASMDIMSIAFNSMGDALANAFAGVDQNARAAIAGMMLAVSRMAFVYALWNTALGIAASTPAGAFLGNPADFFKAAAVFAAVGVAAGLLARGAGAGNTTPGAGGRTAQAAAAAGGRTQSIQIFFEGNVGDEAFFRQAAVKIGRALADGANGGSF